MATTKLQKYSSLLEGVALVGGLARPAHAEQQQALVGRIGYGVQRL